MIIHSKLSAQANTVNLVTALICISIAAFVAMATPACAKLVARKWRMRSGWGLELET